MKDGTNLKEGVTIKFYQKSVIHPSACNVAIGRIIARDSDPACLMRVVGIDNPDQEYWVAISDVIRIIKGAE